MVRQTLYIPCRGRVKVIAEGIETKAELKVLLDMGIDYGQGFVFAYPSEPFPKIRKDIISKLPKKS